MAAPTEGGVELSSFDKAAPGLLEDGAAEDTSESEGEDYDDEELEDKVWWEKHRWLLNFAAVAIYVFLGVLYIKSKEHWDTVTSLYVIMQIVTTIGYGDVTVEDSTSQWFMTFYVFFGVVVCANIMNDFLDKHMDLAKEAMRRHLRVLEAHLSDEIKDEAEAKERLGALNGMMVALLIYLFFIGVGTFFYSTYEHCSCGYNDWKVDGCIDDGGDQCIATGGVKKNIRTALYMSVITLSTTGFGDYSPKSKLGRAVSIVWMPLGVLSFVNAATSVLFWWRHKKAEAKRKKLDICLSDFPKMDSNHNGRVTEAEFRIYFLLKEGIINTQDVKHMDSFFKTLDTHKRGWLSYEDLAVVTNTQKKVSYPYLS